MIYLIIFDNEIKEEGCKYIFESLKNLINLTNLNINLYNLLKNIL